MHAENSVGYQSHYGEVGENVTYELVYLGAESSLALVVEAIQLVDSGTLVVASKKKEVLGVLDLVGEEKSQGFDLLFPSVYIVSQEKIVGLGRKSSIVE